MINQAFTQWAEYPVITTLETISAPIDEIQFPTVTVCDQKPPDNWGPLEKVLNSLAFECSEPTSNCKESTKEIRKDFKFLITSFVEACLELLDGMDFKTLTEARIFKDEIAYYNETGVIDLVAEVLKQEKYEDLLDIAIQNFATRVISFYQNNAMEIKNAFEANYKTDNLQSCAPEICKDQKKAVRILLMLRWIRQGVPFGSFLTQFIHSNKFKSFGSCRHDLCDYWDDMSIECNELDENEKKLHEYFTEISKLFGFNESEILSLYELPGMLTDNLDYVKKQRQMTRYKVIIS